MKKKSKRKQRVKPSINHIAHQIAIKGSNAVGAHKNKKKSIERKRKYKEDYYVQ